MNLTVGRKFNAGKVAQVECVSDDNLKNIKIYNECFLLLLITAGIATFKVGDKTITATAPCFVCFDESVDPVLIENSRLKCHSIYFYPQFLNVNMTFSLIRADFYGDIAHTHDMFLLRPFLDKNYIVPITENYIDKLTYSFSEMKNELENQRDWYWSCRGRSYFMEIIIALERLYGLIGRGRPERRNDECLTIVDPNLKKSIMFIESNYSTDTSLEYIVKVNGINHTTVTDLMKRETGLTVMEYLKQYRVCIAKKQLAFTNVPIKDVSLRCGFKTIQHFSRIFKEKSGKTPAEYRMYAIEQRKKEL